MSADRYAWMSSALCAQSDPDLWTDSLHGTSSNTPKSICRRCPVRIQCGAHGQALEQYEGAAIPGIWGGQTRRQRRQARREQLGEAA